MPASQGTSDPRSESVAIIGSGVAGLITAYTLLHDGFTDVKILTRDLRVGGVWATNRIYPGLYLNKYETFFLSVIFRLRLIDSVHGEYRLSPLEMPAPSSADGRLSGDDMAQYMARFVNMYLQDRVEFGLDISNIRRGSNGQSWLLDVRDVQTGKQETRSFTRIIVCTGVRKCNELVPDTDCSPSIGMRRSQATNEPARRRGARGRIQGSCFPQHGFRDKAKGSDRKCAASRYGGGFQLIGFLYRGHRRRKVGARVRLGCLPARSSSLNFHQHSRISSQ